MQTDEIDINESGRIIIDDRVFYPVPDSDEGMMENKNTNEKAVLKEIEDENAVERIAAFEYELISMGRTNRFIDKVLFPKSCKNTDIDGNVTYYAFTDIPEKWGEASMYPLSKSLNASGFSIISRIMAALNLAEILAILEPLAGTLLFSIHPEDIYVNIESGEVYIWIQQWLNDVSDNDGAEDFGLSPNIYNGGCLNEYDVRFFASYSFFRLLCTDDPFDGDETLLKYPLLTKEAIRSICKDGYRFVFAPGSNGFGDYVNRGLQMKWQSLPAFVREEFEKNFVSGIDSHYVRTSLSQWIVVIRKIRDCLVIVNGQAKFCDPDASNRVLFMEIDDYKIPVWPKKAIYWYHAGIPVNESRNGIVGGISASNGQYFLTNMSGKVWDVIVGDKRELLHPEREIAIVDGMSIEIEDGRTVRVTNGALAESCASKPEDDTQEEE